MGKVVSTVAFKFNLCRYNTATDNFASDFYENASIFCVAMVFGLYFE
jgi:hypothetical protein